MGPAGAKGADGDDGVGIARVEQDIDAAIVVHLTDGSFYTIEMPLTQEDNSLAREVHYKAGGGGGGSGVIDLSKYVKRPDEDFEGKWLVYRETVGNNQGEWAPATTDLIETNGQLMFRDSKGRFAPTPDELDELTNQLKVNRFIWDKIQSLDIDKSGIYIGPLPPSEDDRANGMFWFCNSQDSMQLFVFHDDSEAWIPVAPPATISDRVAKGEETQGALVEAVGELETKVTALEGAVGEHSLIFNPNFANPRAGEFVTKDGGNQVVNTLSAASIIHIAPEDRNGGSIAIDRITEGDVMRLSDISGVTAEVKIKSNLGGGAYEMEKLFGDLDRLSEYPYDFNLFSSFDPQGLATIDYVDERDKTKIGITGWQNLDRDSEWQLRQVDSGNVVRGFLTINDGAMNVSHVVTPTKDDDAATKEYVDQAIASAVIGAPPGRPFRFSSTDSLGAGGFHYSTKNGVVRMRLNKTDADGIVWMYDSPIATANGGLKYSTAFTIRYWDGSSKTWKIRFTGFITRIDWNANDAYCHIHDEVSKDGIAKLANNTKYYITVGGIL